MSKDHLIRVDAEFAQVKGTLLLLAGNGAYFYSEEWLEPIKNILGEEMLFSSLVDQLDNALQRAHNPKFKQVKAEAWARRIAQPVLSAS